MCRSKLWCLLYTSGPGAIRLFGTYIYCRFILYFIPWTCNHRTICILHTTQIRMPVKPKWIWCAESANEQKELRKKSEKKTMKTWNGMKNEKNWMNIFMCPMFQVSSECLKHRLAFKTWRLSRERKKNFKSEYNEYEKRFCVIFRCNIQTNGK